MSKRIFARVENKAARLGNEEQVNMARAQEDSQERRREQFGGRTVKRKSVHDRLGKIVSDLPENIQVEVRSKDLAVTSANLPYCERQGGDRTLRRPHQELADTRRKLSVCKARLGFIIRRRRNLMKDKLSMQREMESLKEKLRESEEKRMELQCKIHQLETARETREHDVQAFFNILCELLLQGLGMANAMRQLNESEQSLD